MKELIIPLLILAYIFFIGMIFQTDDPKFWNDYEPPDITTFSHFAKILYDKETNGFNLSIYNGNYVEYAKQKEVCKKFILSYNEKHGNIEDSISTFYVTIKCYSKSNSIYTEKNTDDRIIMIPFNTTRHDIIVDFPSLIDYDNQCILKLSSNMIGLNGSECFLFLRQPLIQFIAHF